MLNLSSLTKSISLLLSLVVLAVGTVSADNVQVQASVPYPAPTQPATFDGSVDGSTVADALLTLSGTCQIQNPADAVVIQRAGSTIGSTACNSGTYSLQIMLIEGTNVLIAKTINASMIEGPDSQPITVTLVLPPTVNPTPSTPNPTAPAATPDAVTAETNSGAAADLTAVTDEPFSVMSDSNDVTISVTVGGGSTPYTIYLNWGDGTTESHIVDQAGSYSYTHTYTAVGNYTVRGTVKDVLGASTVFEYAVISNQKVSETGTGISFGTNTADSEFWRQILVPTAAATGIAAVLGAGYWFGAHHAVAKALGGTQSNAKKAKRAKTSKTSKTRKAARRRR